SSKYTYLYQIANPASSHATWGSFQPQFSVFTPVSTTSTGSFASGNLRLDFFNGGSLVNASGNNLQGTHSFGIGARTVSGPERIEILSNPLGGRSHPYSTFLNQGVTSGFTSPLFGFQSSNGPTFTTGLLQGDIFAPGSSFAAPVSLFATVPTAGAPEPGTMLLIGTGALSLLAWRWKKPSEP
ncbi:MAG TPA: PEP-CTERM sorting domain-containing protein, partial [Nitrospira sp.]|nr:PEP-CTERM sorting domain-containing protein [Nitrospira sp.]